MRQLSAGNVWLKPGTWGRVTKGRTDESAEVFALPNYVPFLAGLAFLLLKWTRMGGGGQIVAATLWKNALPVLGSAVALEGSRLGRSLDPAY